MGVNAFPLPESWSVPEVVHDAISADGLDLHRAGFSSRGPDGVELTGAAVELGQSPIERGYFELLERVSTVEALRSCASTCTLLDRSGAPVGKRAQEEVFPESEEPARWRYARSNGVALHADWAGAAERARWELAERDRVLRAWYGETRPLLLPAALAAHPLVASHTYEWHTYAFPALGSDHFARDVSVVGVFGMPASDDLPVVSGYAARPQAADAVDAAAREALQLLGFLWGEPVTSSIPPTAPTPLAHLERYQSLDARPLLRDWLDRGHERYRDVSVYGLGRDSTVSFVDLTPSWLRGGLRVVKAVCDAAVPLAFGESPFGAHLPPELRAHPIG
jgi:hypothetical protein